MDSHLVFQSINLGMHGNSPSWNRNGACVHNWAQAGLQGTSYRMTWSKCLWVPFPYRLLFPTFPKESWGVLYDKLTVVWGRLKILSKTKVLEELQSCLQMFWRIFKYHSRVDICYMSGYMYHVYVSVCVCVKRPEALDASGAMSCQRWVLEMRSLNCKQTWKLTKIVKCLM